MLTWVMLAEGRCTSLLEEDKERERWKMKKEKKNELGFLFLSLTEVDDEGNEAHMEGLATDFNGAVHKIFQFHFKLGFRVEKLWKEEEKEESLGLAKASIDFHNVVSIGSWVNWSFPMRLPWTSSSLDSFAGCGTKVSGFW